MAYEILSESYGRRLPKITAEADSTDDLASLGTDFAEGSTCTISDKTYALDKVQGWVEAGSGGGSGGVGSIVVHYTFDYDEETQQDVVVIQEDWDDIAAVGEAGGVIVAQGSGGTMALASYTPAAEGEESFPAHILWEEQSFDSYSDYIEFSKVVYGYASTGESYYRDEEHWYVQTYDPPNP